MGDASEVLEKLSDGVREWMETRGWKFDEDLGIWFDSKNPDATEAITESLIQAYPNEVYALVLKIEGEIPWFSTVSQHIIFRNNPDQSL